MRLFGLGGTEIFIIAMLALLLFGPDKIPQYARTFGKFMREFNRYKDQMESTLRAEVYRSDDDKPTPEKPVAAPAPTAAPTSGWSADEEDEEEEE